MSAADKVRVVFHEEGQHKHADVHTVVIGIGSYDDLVVAEVVDVLLESKSVNKEVEFLILGNLLAAFLVRVDRLASEREYCLCLSITCLGYGSARRVTLGDEDTGLLAKLLLACRELILEVILAVAKLLVVYACTLVALLCLFLKILSLLEEPG